MQGRSLQNPRAASNIDRHIGVRIRTRRLELGVSQGELAVALGVTFQQVQKYEKGTNRVAAATLIKIAATLDAPLSALLPASEAGGSNSVLDTPHMAELALQFSKLNEEGRTLALELVTALTRRRSLVGASARPGGKRS